MPCCHGISYGNSDSNDLSYGTANSKPGCLWSCVHLILGTRLPLEKSVSLELGCFKRNKAPKHANTNQIYHLVQKL